MSERLASILGENNCILVAHPDDETLFAGGLPIVFEDRHWTVICCSIPRRDPIRAFKFHDACVMLGALPMLLPMPEQEINTPPIGLENLPLDRFDCVVTHNEFGDYGHFHHAYLAQWIDANYKRPYVTFGYRPGALGTEQLKLTKRQTDQKLAAMRCYNHFLPYENRDIPKWEALMHRYYEVEGMKPDLETYDIHE